MLAHIAGSLLRIPGDSHGSIVEAAIRRSGGQLSTRKFSDHWRNGWNLFGGPFSLTSPKRLTII